MEGAGGEQNHAPALLFLSWARISRPHDTLPLFVILDGGRHEVLRCVLVHQPKRNMEQGKAARKETERNMTGKK
jgi:hypothetical protein